jgi:hypothetical protein
LTAAARSNPTKAGYLDLSVPAWIVLSPGAEMVRRTEIRDSVVELVDDLRALEVLATAPPPPNERETKAT